MSSLAGVRWVEVPCALCGEDARLPLAEVPGFAVPLRVVRCASCAHVFLSPRPADEDLPLLYDEAYYTGAGEEGGYAYADEREVPEVAALRARARLEAIERLVSPGVLTEVGCSFGAFLLEAGRRGWRAGGVDLSPFAARACAEAGLSVREGTLESAGLPDSSRDVIYLSETAEHLPHPRSTVRAAARALRPGGLIVVATANHASLARLLRGRRWGYYLPGHLQYFTASSLSRLLAEEGLPVVRRRFGDDRSLARRAEIRRREGRGGLPGRIADLLLRLSVGGFSLGAGMVLYGRREA